MAGVVGQKRDGREPDGAGRVGVRRARWQLLRMVRAGGGWQGAGV